MVTELKLSVMTSSLEELDQAVISRNKEYASKEKETIQSMQLMEREISQSLQLLETHYYQSSYR